MHSTNEYNLPHNNHSDSSRLYPSSGGCDTYGDPFHLLEPTRLRGRSQIPAICRSLHRAGLPSYCKKKDIAYICFCCLTRAPSACVNQLHVVDKDKEYLDSLLKDVCTLCYTVVELSYFAQMLTGVVQR